MALFVAILTTCGLMRSTKQLSINVVMSCRYLLPSLQLLVLSARIILVFSGESFWASGHFKYNLDGGKKRKRLRALFMQAMGLNRRGSPGSVAVYPAIIANTTISTVVRLSWPSPKRKLVLPTLRKTMNHDHGYAPTLSDPLISRTRRFHHVLFSRLKEAL